MVIHTGKYKYNETETIIKLIVSVYYWSIYVLNGIAIFSLERFHFDKGDYIKSS